MSAPPEPSVPDPAHAQARDTSASDKQDPQSWSSFFARFKKKEDSDAPPKPPTVSFIQLFRHATPGEKAYILLANSAAAIHGALLPVFTIFFGGIINKFSERDGPIDVQVITDEVGSVAKWFLLLAIIAFFASSIQVRFQLIVSQRVCARIRRLFFKSLMSQDFTWYDHNDGGELTARVAADVNLIQAGIGDKVTLAVQFFFTFIIGVIIAFVYGPLLTLVILSVAPLLIAGGAVLGKMAADSTGDGLGAYGAAGAVANEVIGLIRTVTAYNGQESEARRYEAELDKAYKADCKRAIISGLGLGFTMFIIFCTYAIAFVFGANRVRANAGNDDSHLMAGDVLTTFFAVLIACFSIGQAAPSFQAFAVAQGAAPRVYEVIDRKSEINPLNEDDGEFISDFKGNVEFKNVDFNYQSRVVDDTTEQATSEYVLHGFNLRVPPGASHALVGPSGCGKSTTVRLIERFYDVQNGSVTLDGVDVRNLNVRWLRSQMGYVGQMPTLFALSIRENIALGAPLEVNVDGKLGKTILERKAVSDDDVISAAKQANAHDFIMKLPEQYNTMLGERGALLSGGQKQRICIARALIRNPKILILDESTAALDSQSERVVQSALEKAATGRTTITIAHRLSTVKNADLISVIEKGAVVESGRHHDLLKVDGGAYRTLVEHQNIEAAKVKTVESRSSADGPEFGGEAQVFHESVSKTTRGMAVEGESREEDDTPDIDKGVIARAFKYNAAEFFYILGGLLGASAAGASFPVMAIIFSEVINEMLQENRPGEIQKYALFFVAIGGAAFLGNFMQLACLGVSGERLTRKLRRNAFRSILKQEMGFFDSKENSLGALTTRLATEASLVKGVTGDTLGGVAFGVSTLCAGFLIAYISCWRVALVVTAVFPLMAVAGALQLKLIAGFDADSDKKYQHAGAVASEAVDNFETVTSIGVQDVFMSRYNAELDIPIRTGKRTALVAGIAFGVSEFLAQGLWAVSFWVGSIFVRDEFCDFTGLMKAITGILFGAMMLGQVTTYVPDIAKAKIASTKIFRLLDRVSAINPTDEIDVKPEIDGEVSCQKLYFEYPTRPDVAVLRGLSVGVGRGKTLALVGASGCGKSTVVSLLERFYDVRSGEIKVDGTGIDAMEVKWLRQHIGLVSQEPDLFNRSIRDNIAYGLDHSDGTVVTDEVIMKAAKAANAHTFITELTDGYDTVVGPRGNRLSGGQRQRVAIARAIVREPRLLLLDEATSALDAVSEHVVQEALDKAGTGRTTVAIAHRLSTVKDADSIAVVSRGKIVEFGTHEQLLRISNGEYANLVKNQLSGQDNEDED